MDRIRHLSLAAACAGAMAFAPAAHACSKAPFPISRDGVHLIGTATADTLPAGAAGRRYELEPGTADGPVYGQVVRVERLGGAAAASLPSGTDRVVLVPWGYGANCRTTRWAESAVWADVGERALVWASLRPREAWVQGVPTLDVTEPYQLPYPQRAYADDDEGLLSIDQAFELLSVLPLWDEFEADFVTAHQPLLAWARANPELARRPPAAMMVERVESVLRAERLARLDPPLAGTYRFTLSVDGDAPRTFHARTRAVPESEWDPAEFTDGWRSRALDDPFTGYTLGFEAAPAATVLAVAGRRPEREGYFGVLAPEPGLDGAQLWRGTISLDFAAILPGDSALARIRREERELMIRRHEAEDVAPEETRARFLLCPDGSVTVEQTVVMGEGRVVVLRGERISRVTLPGAR